jgi:hypothetical protein
MRKNAGDACREIGHRHAHYDRVEGAYAALGESAGWTRIAHNDGSHREILGAGRLHLKSGGRAWAMIVFR